jgi:hypothetical protein
MACILNHDDPFDLCDFQTNLDNTAIMGQGLHEEKLKLSKKFVNFRRQKR